MLKHNNSAPRQKKSNNISRRSFSALLAGIGIFGGLTSYQAAAKSPPAIHAISAEDKLDIIELMALYAWSFNTYDGVGFAQTFATDGSLEIYGTELAKGRESLAGFLEKGRERQGDNAWQHLTDHHHFRDCTADSCKVYSYYLMAEGDSNGNNGRVKAMGYYVSYCVKVNGQWLFKKREVHGWNGKKPW